jgi:hypothetical protein
MIFLACGFTREHFMPGYTLMTVGTILEFVKHQRRKKSNESQTDGLKRTGTTWLLTYGHE